MLKSISKLPCVLLFSFLTVLMVEADSRTKNEVHTLNMLWHTRGKKGPSFSLKCWPQTLSRENDWHPFCWPNCLVLIPYKCNTLFSIPHKCNTLFSIPYKCNTLFSIPHKCNTLFSIPYRCNTLFSIPYRCNTLFSDARKCFDICLFILFRYCEQLVWIKTVYLLYCVGLNLYLLLEWEFP